MRFLTVLRLFAALSVLGASAFAQRPVPAALPQTTAQIQLAVDAGQGASAQTHAALAAREQMLLDVFRNDPAAARAYALPLATRQALLTADPTTAPLLEYELNKTGELAASVADNWTNGSSTTLFTLHTPTLELDLALPPAVLATVPMNHHMVTVHGLALAGVVAADTLTEANPTDAAACEPPLKSTAATGNGSSAPLTCSAFGNQRIAVLIVKFPAATPAFPTGLDQAAYWNQVLFGATPSVNSYWNEVSQGQTSATGDVYGPFQLSQQYDCTTTSAMQTAAIAAAAGAVDFSQYNRVIIVYPVTSCTFGGLGNIGCVGASATIAHQYSVVWLPISSNYRADFSYPQMWGGTSHELGHNLGLNHANTLDFNAISLGPLDFSTTNPGTVTGTGAGTGSGSNLPAVNTEYGDNFDVMGYPWISGGPYNAVHRTKILGWIPQSDERDIATSGSYMLVPAENATGLRALHVLRDPSSTSWLWIEYHQQTGYYESGNYQAHIGYGDTELTGAQIHYETPITAYSTPYTYLLDMTPVSSSTSGNNNFYDGTLAPGKSWSDPYSLLTITANAQSAAGLGVTISYDTPCATLSLNASTIPAAGGAGVLTITSPSSCTWTVSSNALWISFPGATSGSGSALIPFTASANTAALQRNTYITAQRQSLPLVQPGSSATILAIAPNTGSSVAGAATPFTLSFSDAAGLSDINQLNLDYTGFGSPDCQVAIVTGSTSQYLYLFANGAFTSGLSVGSAGTLTSPSCTLNAANSSYKATGTSAAITLGLTFTSAFTGEHNILTSAYTANGLSTASIPLGIWTVVAAGAPVSSTTSLTASPASTASFGQSVTFSAAISPATASGMVAFTDGSTALGSFPVNNGIATLTTSTLAVGSHSIAAAYAGDTADAPSASTALAFTVTAKAAIATTIAVSIGPARLTYGATLNLGALVAPAAAGGVVSFQDFTVPAAPVTLATATLAGGAAATATNTLAVGTYKVGASYPGDGTYAASTSLVAGIVTVTQAASSTALSASPQPAYYGNPLTLIAAITSPGGTGSVTFTDGTTTLGKVAVLAGAGTTGTATLTLSSLTAGTHNVTAVYSGDSNVAGSSSAQVPVLVSPATSTVVFTPSATLVTVGAPLSLSAAVTPIAATGSVMFSEYTQNNTVVMPIGQGILANGVATLSLNSLAVGTHTLGAIYGGDANDLLGNSNLVTVTVSAVPGTTTTLTGPVGPVVPSVSVTLTAHVIPSAGISPTGTVNFTDGGTLVATVALNAGAASYTAAGLSPGTHQFSAVYAGSTGSFTGSTSNTFPVIVARLATSFAINASAATAFAGGSIVLTATPGTTANVQTAGTMTFTDGASTLGTVSFANGTTASFTATNLAAGTHTFSAVYSGSIDLNGATGTAAVVAVQDFTIALPSNSVTLNAGTGESFPLTLAPGTAGFTSAIALACTGAPAQAACTIAPGVATPGSSPATATLTLTTTARPAPSAGWLLLGLAPALLAFRKRRLAALLTACAAGCMLLLAGGCGQGNFNSSQSSGTPAGTYSLTITATATGATTLAHTATVSLKVN